jgi:hypothetical protein
MLCQSGIAAGLSRLSLIAAAALAGCSSSVVVQSDFPAPLVEPLPLRMGVIFDDELHNYIYYEELPQHTAWTIDMGDANVGMLEPLFAGMFNQIELIDSVDAAPTANVDGVLQPQLEKFEFDVPIGQRDEFAEVWLQYALTLFEPNGEVVHRWTVSGYGKSELERDQEEAVKRAAVVALRDVGATIATKFSEQQPISYWLGETGNGTNRGSVSETDRTAANAAGEGTTNAD